jgi:hypothetical protein
MVVRTEKEINNPREFNYYLAFKIDPAEKDVHKIEEQLKKFKMSLAQGAPLQRRYIALWQDIMNVMVNDIGYDSESDSYCIPGARARELAAARKYRLDSTARALKLAYGDKLLRSAFRGLTPCDKFVWYSRTELEDAVKALGVTVSDDERILDFVRYNDVDSLLRIAGKESLYDLLNANANDTCEVLCAAADNVYRAIENRTSSEGAAVGSLVGHAKRIFSSKETKSAYDLFLASRERVWDEMKAVRDGGCRVVSVKTRKRWVAILEFVHGLPHEDAKCYVKSGMTSYGILIV